MAEIIYDAKVPPEVVAAVSAVLEPNAGIVPPWCRMLTVEWAPRMKEGIAASVSSEHEYRHATVTVAGDWLGESADAREREMIHELVHLPLDPLVDFFTDAMQRLTEDERLRDWIAEQWRQRYEATVCDLTDAILARRTAPTGPRLAA